MFKPKLRFFSENTGLKFMALALALVLWFYVVNEVGERNEEEKRFVSTVLPTEGLAAKKLTIMPVFIGEAKYGYSVDAKKAVVIPEFCIVVGSKELLAKMKFAYTMPIDIEGISKTFTKFVPLNPISPGIFMEETLVQVTVPVDRER